MEYVFENVGVPDIRAITEMRYRMNATRIGIWTGVYLLLGIYFLRNYLLGYGYLYAPLLFTGFAVYFAVSPYFVVQRAWKKELAFHNGVMPVNTARFGEKVSIENATASRSWEYHHLTKVCSFKYSYCLCFADKTVLLVGRDGFTKGNFTEFKRFLRYVRPDLNIPE